MRIKVDSDATDASVSDITYSGNTISANDKYGLLISQSYSEDCTCLAVFLSFALFTDTTPDSWNSWHRQYHLVRLELVENEILN